jgi:hypothetical protein
LLVLLVMLALPLPLTLPLQSLPLPLLALLLAMLTFALQPSKNHREVPLHHCFWDLQCQCPLLNLSQLHLLPLLLGLPLCPLL